MKKETLKLEFPIYRGDFSSAGETSSKIKRILQNIGFRSKFIRRISIAVYEAEMNLVIHSFGGIIKAYMEEDSVRIYVEDQGPGIKDINLAMQEGYSTASDEIREMGFGAGMGLPNMKKCSDHMYIQSKIGVGTKIMMEFYDL
ncbi:ATP-binding protein [Garciella nitratireducens]|uniref:Anti-sigma regulatory factor (Ser/Thr protein kinase) n=1 Tax=Garciella nitratireducens DSM 15102 TaxID=1121911 RepID=A0A1T4L0U0_9FIRM|nr:ATP-binding protein [Garciella nitratireducens]RBP36420.1 anti-sigma regulatory factor (Ser/Thr protein kinase) [Garciella nitratireducens]SJZ48157.1 Anti-sigma regulatory factor (Ser/Thr protein kinase) [Garciella nitratireducens DSM 15102]